MTADQLRKSILQQAIQGKLVPQDPNDEPASVLLERIREEKARLVEEKKIKKEKNPSIIFRGEDNSYYEKFTLSGEVKCIDEEIPFEIPNGWEWCRLGNIVDFSTNLSVKSNVIPPDAWLLDLEDIEKETGKILQKKRYIDVISKSDKHKFFSNNILYSKLRPYLNKVVLADEEGFCTSEILVFDFNLIYNKYALWYLRSPFFVEYAMKDAYGVKMPRLGSNQGNMSLFPLPPLKEQQCIVEKIEELIPLIEHYGKTQTELDTLNKNIKEKLKKSVLQYAIEGKLVAQDEAEGTAEVLLLQIQKEKQKLYEENKLKKKDLEHSTIFKAEDNKYYEKIGKNIICIDEEIPFEIPKNWRWVRMGQIANLYTGNSINEQEKKTQYMNTEGVPYIGTKDIGFDGKVLYQNGVAIPKKHLSLFKKAYSNSILICIEGGSAGRKITLIDKTVCFGNKLCCITSYYEKIRYLFYYLQSPMFFEIFNQTKNGIIGGVSVNNLKNLIVPLPPLNEQQRIEESIDATFRCIEN